VTRPLTPFRTIQVGLVALATLGLAAAILVAIETVPEAFTTASTLRQAAMVVGTYLTLFVLFAIVYKRLPQSRVR